MPVPPRLLLFEPHAGGHHAEHVRHIMKAWRNSDLEGTLVATVTPQLLQDDPDLCALAAGSDARVHLEAVLSEEPPHLRRGLRSDLRLGRLLGQCLAAYRPAHVLLLYMDALQWSLALDLRFRHPVRLSGILFATTFRYAEASSSAFTRVKRALRRPLLTKALRNPHLQTVFCLDSSAVPDIEALGVTAEAVALPDPVAIPTALAAPRAVRMAWGIEPHRRLLLLFGSLAERKGVLQLLEAVRRLPDRAAERLSVVLAGRVVAGFREQMDAAIADVRRASPVQLILRDAYLPSDEVQGLVGAADLVLAPYQWHVGSSGVLIRAAAARRPVLTQEFGLVGAQVREHRLGQAVDTAKPAALADALLRFLDDPACGFDPARAGAFAEANSVDAYVRVLFDHLLMR